MRYLLDTHTLLWIITGNKFLSKKVKALYLDESNEIFISMAVLWEIAIKVSLEKLIIEGNMSDLILNHVEANGIKVLNIGIPHIILLETLPWHHRDPFDRIMVCQSMVENIPLVSRDAALDAYPVKRIW